MHDRATSARLSPETRQHIRASRGTDQEVAERLGITVRTVTRWRNRESVLDGAGGPRRPTAVSELDEAIAVLFRRIFRLPLDDCLKALRPVLPTLSRSTLHRCYQRHGLDPVTQRKTILRRSREVTPQFVTSLIQVPASDGHGSLFVAVDEDSKLAFARYYGASEENSGVAFEAALRASMPYAAEMIVAPTFETTWDLFDGDLEVAEDIAGSFESDIFGAGRAGFSFATIERERQHGSIAEWVDSLLISYNERCTLSFLRGETPSGFAAATYSSERQPVRRGDTAGGARSAPNEMTPSLCAARPAGAALGMRAAATRTAILEAAGSRLAYDGPEGLSLSEVARLAGVNRRTAYQHFGTRERLVRETEHWVSEQLYRAIFGDPATIHDRAVDSIDPADVATRLASFAMENPELCRGWLLRVLSSADPAEDIFWREYQGSAARFATTELAQPMIDTEVMSVIMLAGAFLWPVWARAKAGEGTALQSLADRFARESIRMSMFGNLQSQHYPDIVARLEAGLS